MNDAQRDVDEVTSGAGPFPLEDDDPDTVEFFPGWRVRQRVVEDRGAKGRVHPVSIPEGRRGILRSVERGDPCGLTDEVFENSQKVADLAAKYGGDPLPRLDLERATNLEVIHTRVFRIPGDPDGKLGAERYYPPHSENSIEALRDKYPGIEWVVQDPRLEAGRCTMCGNTEDHADLGYINYSHVDVGPAEYSFTWKDGTVQVIPWGDMTPTAGRQRLRARDQQTVDLLAHVYYTRALVGKADLGVLISTGFALTVDRAYHGYEAGHLSMVDTDGHDVEMLLTPVTVEAAFCIPVSLLEDTFRKAKALFPNLDLRRQWLGGRALDAEGLRVMLRLLYYVPDAPCCAREGINGPPLGVYPTATYPHGYLNLPRAVWSFRSIRCADATALTMALVIPLDDLVGLDFTPCETTGGLPPMACGQLPEPMNGFLDGEIEYGLSYGVYSGNAEHDASYAYTMSAAMKRVDAEFDLDAPLSPVGRGPELAPPICEVLRMQRPIVMAATRLTTSVGHVGRYKTTKRNRAARARKRRGKKDGK